ncbi:MAG: hypothetical protein H6751_14065 [Candidatus Omnitrophica bacterium]|nr:hypothetical protein [Candidatus Omnitrophota bacterium]
MAQKTLALHFSVMLPLLTLTSSYISWADPPPTINIQGTLQDSQGDPLTGVRDYRVRFFDSETEGSSIVEVSGTTTLTSSGRFSLAVDPPEAALDAAEMWYELAIDEDGDGVDPNDVFPERVKVHSVPFALRAQDAETVGGMAASEFATTDALSSGLADKADLDHHHNAEYWSIEGNPGGEGRVLGTTDDQSFQIIVGGTRTLLFAPKPSSPNIVGGYWGNEILTETYGSVIAGGGSPDHINSVTGNYSFIGGGNGNVAGGSGATVSGGFRNKARAETSAVSGGWSNSASGYSSTVGGGYGNVAAGSESSVGGGEHNLAQDAYATVSGGRDNHAAGMASSVGGGLYNGASGVASVVSGGDNNYAPGRWSIVAGGKNNTASGESSFASGRMAKALHDGAFVWADSTFEDFSSTAVDQFSVRANGGSRFFCDGANSALYVETSGTGRTGHFRITNPDNDSNSVAASTQGDGNALVGYTIGSGNGVYGETTSSGWAGYFVGSGGSSKGVHIETNGGQGLEVVGGAKSAVVPTSQGQRALYTEEAAEVWFTDYGIGHLENGRAVIPIDSLFAETVNLEEPYHVFVQLNDSESEGVAVEEKTATSFTVVELRSGDSNAEFSYRIVAKRRGFEEVRLEERPNL